MSCEKFDRERYEDELARYIRTALGLPDGVLDVYIKHVPVGTCGLGPDPTISLKRDIVGIEVFIEAMPVFFSVRLHDWPLERSIEEDLGPRFVQALGLLLEACSDARHYDLARMARMRELGARGQDAESSEKVEAAERLEPDPQPQDHDHPRERGKSP